MAETSGQQGGTGIGSSYTGPKVNGRANGYGRYVYEDGSFYEGDFKDDLYHGNGQIVFQDGTVFRGVWNMGKLSECDLVFPDGLVYDGGFPTSDLPNSDKPWGYCDGNDRRFWPEIVEGLSGKPRITATGDQTEIPSHTLDTGDGYYDPEKRKIFTYDGLFKRNVDNNEHFWIISTCRKGWMEPVGRNPTTHLS